MFAPPSSPLASVAQVGARALLLVALVACDRGTPSASASSPSGPHGSVRSLMLAIDDALRRGSEPALLDLMVDVAALGSRCASVDRERIDDLARERTERPLSSCVNLTDWSGLRRGVVRFPFSDGMNVDTKVCDEAWNGCPGVARMCKSEIFYYVPATPDAGFKVSLSGIVRIDDEYRLLRPPRCGPKGTNAK